MRACVLMNKDVRPDIVMTGNEQITEQMYGTGMEDTIHRLLLREGDERFTVSLRARWLY